MFLRYLSLSFLLWITNLIATVALLRYAIPRSWSGNLQAAPIWVVAFIIAFLFAEWAFRHQLPGRREASWFILTWILLSNTLNILGSIQLFQTPRVALYGTDLHLTTLFQVIAMILAAIATRRKKIVAALGEGMEA